MSHRVNSARTSAQFGVPLPPTAPPPQTKVFVETQSGFLSQAEVDRVRTGEAERVEKGVLDSAMDTFGLSASGDAATYESFVVSMVEFSRRLVDMLGGFASGFSAFMMLAWYVDSRASPNQGASSFFVSVYALYYGELQKTSMALCIYLVTLMLIPTAFEYAMANPNRAFAAPSGAGKGGVQMPSLRDLFQSSSSSPFRHVISVRTFMYIAALCATIVETSVIQNRDETQIRALSGSELDRLHVAFLVRGIALIAASLMILTNKPLNLSHHLQTRRIREVVVNAPTGGGAGVGASQATLQPPSTSQSMPSNFASRM